MKDDTISREAALNCVYGTSPNKIKGRIAELPSAQPVEDARAMCGECDACIQYKNYPQPGWIPVTERLPERYDNYLITTDEEDVDIGTFHPEFKHWSICDADGFMWMDGVLAWCELPTPYREGGCNA